MPIICMFGDCTQRLYADGVGGLPLKVTGTVLDHRLCAQQSVYDARGSSRMKVRLHAVRDWVVDFSPHVAVWLITDWAWYRYSVLHKLQLRCSERPRNLLSCIAVMTVHCAAYHHRADSAPMQPTICSGILDTPQD